MEILTTLALVLAMAAIVQFLTGVIKTALPAGSLVILTAPRISIVLGILLAILFQVDAFAAVGFTTFYPIAAWILTGLLISAGAEPLHELIAKLRESRAPNLLLDTAVTEDKTDG